MRWVLSGVGCCVLGIALFYALIIAASESGEVVRLRTGTDGDTHESRLWIVDYDGSLWLRTGNATKRWFRDIERVPECELERDGRVTVYRALPVRDISVTAEVNQAFASKYGAADWIVALSGNAANRVVVRLEPSG